MRRGHSHVAPEQSKAATAKAAGEGYLRHKEKNFFLSLCLCGFIKTDTDIMLSCEEARRIIPLYLDSELPGVELARFEAHIEVCDACEYLLSREREWLSTLRAASPLYKVPDNLRESIELMVRADGS